MVARWHLARTISSNNNYYCYYYDEPIQLGQAIFAKLTKTNSTDR